jgi:hypothetical protein
MSDTTARRRPKTAQASGRFLLRLPTKLHAFLREAARDAGLSLNDLCVKRLGAAGGQLPRGSLATAVDLAIDTAGQALVGVAAFGSWARAQASDTSDIDVLIVVDPAFELTRSVYRRLDERALVVDGRKLEAHIARLPDPGARISGLWAEVAIDGVVLLERGLRLSAHLARIRRAIISGRLVRDTLHGQPYWHEVA